MKRYEITYDLGVGYCYIDAENEDDARIKFNRGDWVAEQEVNEIGFRSIELAGKEE